MNNYKSVLDQLSEPIKKYVLEKAEICQPDSIYICDGSEEENNKMIDILLEGGAIKKLNKYENCWLVRTDPADVARVESKTFISTDRKEETIPVVNNGVLGCLGNWIAPDILREELNQRFTGCMKGRIMYVIGFSMGPVGGELSKIGIELTDSPYVVMSMRIMTRIGKEVLMTLGESNDFVRAIHSVGVPLPTMKTIINGWPCNPEQTIIAHIPDKNEICSFGSGYGGNSLLGKKCFALRLGSILGRKEGWFAEHMLIVGITDTNNIKRYIAAAFPSACGKTNLAMLQSTLPGYKIECIGDDIAWMKFDKNGDLRAINPESGFFGVAPGTSLKTNPNAMHCIRRNTIFTNVAETSDGGFYWEGMEDEIDFNSVTITDWHGNEWNRSHKTNAAHPNSRFCTPASQCPIIDKDWESPDGVVISAIVFGGRRPEGVPLIYETFNWEHKIFVGASMRSGSTAAAEHKSNIIMHDPFAMRPFFGYNFGDYLQHWLSFRDKQNLKLPRIFHVNWFRKSVNTGKFIWPGFGDNCRVLEWILKRLDGTVGCRTTAIGHLPNPTDINMKGLDQSKINLEELFSVPNQYWKEEVKEIKRYFEEQVGDYLPMKIKEQVIELEQRLINSNN